MMFWLFSGCFCLFIHGIPEGAESSYSVSYYIFFQILPEGGKRNRSAGHHVQQLPLHIQLHHVEYEQDFQSSCINGELIQFNLLFSWLPPLLWCTHLSRWSHGFMNVCVVHIRNRLVPFTSLHLFPRAPVGSWKWCFFGVVYCQCSYWHFFLHPHGVRKKEKLTICILCSPKPLCLCSDSCISRKAP